MPMTHRRRVTALVSVKGAPGVTTAVLALATAWPAQGEMPVVVEADARGGDIAAASGLGLRPGLPELAAASRPGAAPSGFGAWSQPAKFRAAVVVAPVLPDHAEAAVRSLASHGLHVARAAQRPGGEALVDAGCLSAGGRDLLAHADRVLVVCRGSAQALTQVSGVLPRLAEGGRAVEVLLLGRTPFGEAEMCRALGVGRLLRLPLDPRGARSLTGTGRVRHRSALLCAATVLAGQLACYPPLVDNRSVGSAFAAGWGTPVPAGGDAA